MEQLSAVHAEAESVAAAPTDNLQLLSHKLDVVGSAGLRNTSDRLVYQDEKKRKGKKKLKKPKLPLQT